MKTVSYANVIGFFAAIGLFVISRSVAMGESRMAMGYYWLIVISTIILTAIGIGYSTMPKWVKAIYIISQIIVLCLGISHSNSVHEILFVLAMISMFFLSIPIMVWMNLHMMSSNKNSTKR